MPIWSNDLPLAFSTQMLRYTFEKVNTDPLGILQEIEKNISNAKI